MIDHTYRPTIFSQILTHFLIEFNLFFCIVFSTTSTYISTNTSIYCADMPKRIDNRFVPRYTLFCLAFLLVAWNIISNHRGKNIDLKRTGSCSVPLAAEAATSFHASLRANLTFIKATRHADMRSFNFLILILCGDIEVNPGPRAPKYPCGICCKAVKNSDMAVCCDDCDSWIHNRCSGVSAETYKRLEGNACSWICPKCSLPTFSDSFFFRMIHSQHLIVSLYYLTILIHHNRPLTH